MKKYLFSLVLVAFLLIITVGLASANGGPHGGYTATTDACAGCHRAHTAVGPSLVVASSTYVLCTNCHGSAGLGANTNVDDGLYTVTRDDTKGNGNVGSANTTNNGNLLAGGFVNYKGAAVTSAHSPNGTATGAWGQGLTDRGVATALAAGAALDCASCHDPHGSANYRILKSTINGAAVTVAQVDEAAKDYDTEQWGANQSQVCKACHNAYHQTAPNQGSTLSGSTYTHRVDMPFTYGANVNPEVGKAIGGVTVTLPLAETGTNNTVVCQTCHLPHGTSSAMTALALAGAPNTADSALLRVDNRGVCEACHQK